MAAWLPVTRSATTRPMPGPMPKPWPLTSPWRWSGRESPRPGRSTGTTSGMVSIMPAQAAFSLGRPSAGKARAKASCTRPSVAMLGAGFRMRIASKGEGASADQRRGVLQASGKPSGAAGRKRVDRQSFFRTGR